MAPIMRERKMAFTNIKLDASVRGCSKFEIVPSGGGRAGMFFKKSIFCSMNRPQEYDEAWRLIAPTLKCFDNIVWGVVHFLCLYFIPIC